MRRSLETYFDSQLHCWSIFLRKKSSRHNNLRDVMVGWSVTQIPAYMRFSDSCGFSKQLNMLMQSPSNLQSHHEVLPKNFCFWLPSVLNSTFSYSHIKRFHCPRKARSMAGVVCSQTRWVKKATCQAVEASLSYRVIWWQGWVSTLERPTPHGSCSNIAGTKAL